MGILHMSPFFLLLCEMLMGAKATFPLGVAGDSALDIYKNS